jgi:uncharacterized protein (DUF885 family)
MEAVLSWRWVMSFPSMLAGLLALVPLLPGAGQGDLDRLFVEYREASRDLFPTQASEAGDHSRDDRWENPLSAEHRAAQAALHRTFLERAEAVEREALDDEQRLNLDLFVHQRRAALAELAFPDHLLPLNPIDCGAWRFASAGQGESFHPFESVRDYENFLARVDGFEAWCESAIDDLQRGVEGGIVLPRPIAVRVLERLREVGNVEPGASDFRRPLERFPDNVSPDDRARLTAAFEEAIEKRILPLYRMLARFVERDYVPRCRTTLGWSALPDGPAWYAALVSQYTTTALTPEELFALGEREVARIGPALLEAGKRADEASPTLYATADEVAEAYRARLALVRENLGALLDVAPRTKLEIRPNTVGTFYEPGAPDGSRPGVYWFSFDGPTTISEATFVHEAIPGHHYQMMLQRESNQPDFRKEGLSFAFIEGWGLYAESLGSELGLYRDPYQEYARLYSEMFRALRLVWDVGLHAKGWSFEDCARYAAPWGFTLADIRRELERYVAWPAQALSYKTGELAIRALRDHARTELGEAFSLREFHAFVLELGAVPLDILEREGERWIAERRQ